MAQGLRINNNIAALNTRRHANINSRDLGTRLERLSSGLRINSAEDDAAGLSISEQFRAQIVGLTVGVRNAEMGANLLQVAEGALNEVSTMMIRMRELAMQSASSTMNNVNREAIEAEVMQIKQEIDRIAQSSVYNDQTLLTGFGNRPDQATSTAIAASGTTGVVRVSVSGSESGVYTFDDSATDGYITLGNGTVSQTVRISNLLDQNEVATGTTSVVNFDRLGIQVTLAGHNVTNATGSYVDGDLDGETIVVTGGTGGSFQVGIHDDVSNRVEVGINDMRSNGALLNLGSVSLGTMLSARQSLASIDMAINRLTQQRGDIGSVMNRLQHTINHTENTLESTTASESSIRDADVAEEVTALTRVQVLSQAATAMLAQANASSQGALSLLQQ